MNTQNNENQNNSSTPLNSRSPQIGVDLNKKLIIAIIVGVFGTGYFLTKIFDTKKVKENEIVQDEKAKNLENLDSEKNINENPLMLPENYAQENEENNNLYDKENMNEVNGDSYFDSNGFESQRIEADNSRFESENIGNSNYANNDYYDYQQQLIEMKRQQEEERNKAILESRKSNISFSSKEKQESQSKNESNSQDELLKLLAANSGNQNQQQSQDYYKMLNQQGNKKAFSNTTNSESNWYLKGNLQNTYSKYEVKAGSIIPATLITGINSDLPGYATAIVRESIYDTVNGKYLLIPKGAKLIGEYSSEVTFAQNRVMLVWQRLIMPNGKSINLENMGGVDLTGMTGLKDKVDNHFWKLLQGVILSAMIGGTTDATKDSSNATTYAQESASTVAQGYTDKYLNTQPTITIKQGTKFNVFVNKDMILEPYKD